MNEKKKQSEEEIVSRFFDQCFEEGLFRDFEPGELQRTLKLVEWFGIKKGWRIIEPGCGCGRMTRLLAEKVGPEGQIEACELSPLMVEYCRRAGFPSWVIFCNKSVLSLNLPPGGTDAIVCFNVWPHFSGKRAYLDRFKRFLKRDGFLYIAHSCGREFINAIHKSASVDSIREHMLPPVEELSRQLKEEGWRTLEKCEEDDLYFLKVTKAG